MSFLSQPITFQSLFRTNRTIDSLTVNVVVSENTVDTLVVTKQPVQQGASISDHAYLEPTVLNMRILQEDNLFTSLQQSYNDFLQLQKDRVPFVITTPKRIYQSMLMTALRLTTDKLTENVLSLDMTFQEVIIVSVTTTSVPREAQSNPGSTGKTNPAGKKQLESVLSRSRTLFARVPTISELFP